MPDDFQAQIDAVVSNTLSIVAAPTDGCVIQSLAAQLLLARRENQNLKRLMRRAIPTVESRVTDYADEFKAACQ